MNIKLLANTFVLWAKYHGFIGVKDWNTLKQKCCEGVTDIEDCSFADHLDPHYRNESKDECGKMILYYLDLATPFSHALYVVSYTKLINLILQI